MSPAASVRLPPAGWLVIEDFDSTWLPLEPSGEPSDVALFQKVLRAFYQVLEQAGVNLAYGRRFHSLLREHGLVGAHVEAHIQFTAGGSPGSRLYRANIEQLRERLTGLGLLSDPGIDRFCDLLKNPQFSSNHPKTVEMHIRHILSKLSLPHDGQHNRRVLAALVSGRDAGIAARWGWLLQSAIAEVPPREESRALVATGAAPEPGRLERCSLKVHAYWSSATSPPA